MTNQRKVSNWGNPNGLADLSPQNLARAKSAAPVSAEPVAGLVSRTGGGVMHAANYTECQAKQCGYPLPVYAAPVAWMIEFNPDLEPDNAAPGITTNPLEAEKWRHEGYELTPLGRLAGQAQQPVSGADELAAFEASGLTHNLRRNDTPGLHHTFADAFTEELWDAWKARAALAQQDVTLQTEVLGFVRMLEANEWADHGGESDLGQRLERAITTLQNRIADLTKSSSQQDADKVDAERYRYLRGYRGHKATGVLLKGILFNGHESQARTDEVIDAARKALE